MKCKTCGYSSLNDQRQKAIKYLETQKVVTTESVLKSIGLEKSNMDCQSQRWASDLLKENKWEKKLDYIPCPDCGKGKKAMRVWVKIV